ncbi:hypothetical protein [Leifsonia sp. NPDC080035]|uniref:Uncharacterized protein n=1 Tax=Leifsonia sp. NPDC080035 TaxID=3143936 RepID=A0AAU7GBC2_9MICO
MCNTRPGLRCQTHTIPYYQKSKAKYERIKNTPESQRKAGELEKAKEEFFANQKAFDLLAVETGYAERKNYEEYQEKILQGYEPTPDERRGYARRQLLIARYVELSDATRQERADSAELRERLANFDALRREAHAAHDIGLFLRSTAAAQKDPSYTQKLVAALKAVIGRLMETPLSRGTETPYSFSMLVHDALGMGEALRLPHRWSTTVAMFDYLQSQPQSNGGRPLQEHEQLIYGYAKASQSPEDEHTTLPSIQDEERAFDQAQADKKARKEERATKRSKSRVVEIKKNDDMERQLKAMAAQGESAGTPRNSELKLLPPLPPLPPVLVPPKSTPPPSGISLPTGVIWE